ncbi:transmembrane protein [Cystoisospora suis]|uniref:Transmembrane protein n=1 Tax=Cystoisospora suis TaxID=483139 RepID=A0A2C6LBA5_9APIC|nr:transmembrane protein [Cystoisospora suis]
MAFRSSLSSSLSAAEPSGHSSLSRTYVSSRSSEMTGPQGSVDRSLEEGSPHLTLGSRRQNGVGAGTKGSLSTLVEERRNTSKPAADIADAPPVAFLERDASTVRGRTIYLPPLPVSTPPLEPRRNASFSDNSQVNAVVLSEQQRTDGDSAVEALLQEDTLSSQGSFGGGAGPPGEHTPSGENTVHTNGQSAAQSAGKGVMFSSFTTKKETSEDHGTRLADGLSQGLSAAETEAHVPSGGSDKVHAEEKQSAPLAKSADALRTTELPRSGGPRQTGENASFLEQSSSDTPAGLTSESDQKSNPGRRHNLVFWAVLADFFSMAVLLACIPVILSLARGKGWRFWRLAEEYDRSVQSRGPSSDEENGPVDFDQDTERSSGRSCAEYGNTPDTYYTVF